MHLYWDHQSQEILMTNHVPIALVTGGSRGLGRSNVEALARRGVTSIFTYNTNRSEADKVVSLIEQAGGKAVELQLDTSDTSSFDAFVISIQQTLKLSADTK